MSITRLYDRDTGEPRLDFNDTVKAWLASKTRVAEHATPIAFESTRIAYEELHAAIVAEGTPRAVAHRHLLSDLTRLLMGIDLSGELAQRLTDTPINPGGIRTTISQGVVKNAGENFANIMVYVLADLLSHQDEILVDKGSCPRLGEALRLERKFSGSLEARDLHLNIESDFCVFSRSGEWIVREPNAGTRYGAATRRSQT